MQIDRISAPISPSRPHELIYINDESGEISLVHNGDDPLSMRAKILNLKDRLMAATGEHIEMPVEHTFADGMYLRKLFIKKGTIIVGKIHKQECINIVSKGDISVLTETGSKRLTAGFTGVSPAGIQKVGYAHEDTEFINVFLTNETNIEKLELDLSCENYDELGLSITIEGIEICQ